MTTTPFGNFVASDNGWQPAPKADESTHDQLAPRPGESLHNPPLPSVRNQVNRPARLLDPGLCLTLRPMMYPEFFETCLEIKARHSSSGSLSVSGKSKVTSTSPA